MDSLPDLIVARFNYWIYVILMMIGLWAMIAKNNLIKKLIGMSIFQTAIILFYVSIGVKHGATIPILEHHHEDEHAAHVEHSDVEHADDARHHEAHGGKVMEHPVAESAHVEATHGHEETDPDDYANPLPHVLMLTAIVVGVATLGLGLAITQKIYRQFNSMEEDEILELIEFSDD